MRAIEKTLHELAQSTPNVLYERAHELHIGGAVRINHRAARRHYVLAALMGSDDAKFQLGLMNLRGEGKPVDRIHSTMWLKLASAGSDPRVARNLQLAASAMTRADVNQAFALAKCFPDVEQALRAAVYTNDADAMVNLGDYLTQGHGVERDLEMASEWFRRALPSGHPRAQLRFGLVSLRGEGVTRNAAEGQRWLELAAAQGQVDAQYELAQILRTQPDGGARALTWYEKAAGQGHAGAECRLGELYKEGAIAVPDAARVPAGRRDIAPHLVRAFEWFSKAAQRGDPTAQSELGQMHAQGTGTKQDLEQAAYWYQQAAEQGHAKAQCNLGFLHAHGQGVLQDEARAYQWYRISELGGYGPAKQAAALAAKKISPEAKELADWRVTSFINSKMAG